jgi:ABC-2 type transport system permease protein
MYTLAKLTWSSIKMFVRNRQAVFFTLFMPIIIMAVFGLLGLDNVPKTDVGMAISAPPTQGTRQFVDQLKQIEAFEIHEGPEFRERQALDRGDRAVVLVIPADLMPENPAAGLEKKSVNALTNVGQTAQAQTVISVVSQILDKTTISASGAPTFFEVNREDVNARNLDYFDFLLPGVVALAIMQMSVFSVAFVFVDFKEKGILKRLIATPMKPYHFVSANVITRLIVAVVQSMILIAVGVLLFGAQVIGSYWLMLICIILGAIMFLGLGFAISGLAKTVEAVPAIANLIVFPMLFLAGTFFPTETMPDWLETIVNYMPLTHLSHSLREIMNHGVGFAEIQTDILWMLGWSVILVILANFTFGLEEKRV